jgi:hypothetical protein
MLRPRALLGMLAIALLMGGWLHGEDTKDGKDDKKIKGTLPANWGKLGLTDKQKQDVYKAQSEYKDKIADLEKQIKELKEAEKSAMEKVLTDEQKKRLKEIVNAKLPDTKDPDKKDDKKTDKKDDKKTDKKEPDKKDDKK